MGRTGFRTQSREHRNAQSYADSFDGLPDDVEYFTILNMTKRVQSILGLNGTDVNVLELLFLYSRKQDWNEGARPIVWPSNDLLSQHLHKSIATISRSLTKLIEKGIIVSKDSPNGKRFGNRRSGQRGSIILEESYGFDLSPMAVRYESFVELDSHRQDTFVRFKKLKRKITICRKMIRMTIEAALDAKLEGDWMQFDYDPTQKAINLGSALDILAVLDPKCELLISQYDYELKRIETIREHSKNDNHIHSTNQLPISTCNRPVDKRNCSNEQHSKNLKIANRNLMGRQKNDSNFEIKQQRKVKKPIKVMNELFVKACPQFHEFVHEDTFSGKVETAEMIRQSLQINDSAWEDAYNSMGTEAAVVAIGVMLEKQETINSNGGYLRSLTEAYIDGELNLLGSLVGLAHH